MTALPSPFEPRRALDVLGRRRVRFVVIGGIAAAARGSPSATFDLDVCYARDDENLERLAAALQELAARLRGAPEDVPFLFDAATLKAGDHFTFQTSAGALDCLAGTRGFDDLNSNASRLEIAGREVAVASIDDLIRMKRAAGRPKDFIEVEVLTALRDEVEGQNT